MKKTFKALAVCAVAGTLCAGVAAFAGCGDAEETYFGQHHYTSYGHEYGIAVNVTVKGDDIIKVEKVASGYMECSAATNENWGEDQVANWNNNIDGLLAKYADKSVTEVKAATGAIKGQAEATADSLSDKDLLITGATQGSVRVLKAVQDALNNKAPAAKVAEGEFHYNSYNHEYGIKVNVSVVDGKIFGVDKVASDYVECSAATNEKWGETQVANWNDNFDDLLSAYVGMTTAEVNAVTGTIKGQADATADSLSDNDLLISGATQGSVRVLKAVQDALGKL